MTLSAKLRLILVAGAPILALPTLGCDIDTHSTATGLTKSENLKPGNGPGGSGSITTFKNNAGGPGRVEPKK